jgi:hypothetical protein
MNENLRRRDGESAQAYEALRVYCDLRSDRSIAEVAKKLGRSSSKSLFSGWSTKWNWVDRARDYDEFFDQQIKKALAEAAREAALKVAEEWKKREQAYRERKYQTHLRGLDKVDKMLEFPLATITKETVEGPGGEIIRKTTVNPARWTFDTPARLARIMFELGSQALRNAGAAEEFDGLCDVTLTYSDYIPDKIE